MTRTNRRHSPGRHGGRDLSALAEDFGHHLPSLPNAPMAPAPTSMFGGLIPLRGPRRAGAGWAPVPAPLPVWQMTSDQTPGVWPLIASDAMPATGALVGIDWLSGGAFHADPIGWTLNGEAGVTNPNMAVFGSPGRGKSSLIKTFCLRMMAYGYRTLILGDVKDEYEPMCRALGVAPHAIGPGLPARINPLDAGPLATGWENLTASEAQRRAAIIFSRWQMLLQGLIGSQGVVCGPSIANAIAHILRQLTGYTDGSTHLREVTIPQVWHALDNPDDAMIHAARYRSRQHMLDETRSLRDALGSLVKGHLAGLFDAPTTIQVDWDAPVQSLSLARLEPLGDEAIGIGLAALNSWGRAMTDAAEPGSAPMTIVVRDEAWKVMRLGVDAVKALDGDLRLSRRDGCVQIIVAHKPSDLLTVGDAGSQAVAIARDLIHLCSTKVLLGQDERIGEDLAGMLGLSPMAEQVVTHWATGAPGRALWIVGQRAFKVAAVRSATEISLTDTNEAIRR